MRAKRTLCSSDAGRLPSEHSSSSHRDVQPIPRAASWSRSQRAPSWSGKRDAIYTLTPMTHLRSLFIRHEDDPGLRDAAILVDPGEDRVDPVPEARGGHDGEAPGPAVRSDLAVGSVPLVERLHELGPALPELR